MSGKQERLWVHNLNWLENISLAEYRTRSRKINIKSVSIGIMLTKEVRDQEHVVSFTPEQEQAKEMTDAKKRERKNLEIHGVHEYMNDIVQKSIPRWVITEKFKVKRKIMSNKKSITIRDSCTQWSRWTAVLIAAMQQETFRLPNPLQNRQSGKWSVSENCYG